MREFRAFEEVEAEYFQKHPEEIESYLIMIFEEYAQDGNLQALLTSLRTIGRVKGINTLAERTGITRKGIQKALSDKGNPKFGTIHTMMQAMGYQLMPQKVIFPTHPH